MVRFVKTTGGEDINPEHIVSIWLNNGNADNSVMVQMVSGDRYQLPCSTLKDAYGYLGAIV